MMFEHVSNTNSNTHNKRKKGVVNLLIKQPLLTSRLELFAVTINIFLTVPELEAWILGGQ